MSGFTLTSRTIALSREEYNSLVYGGPDVCPACARVGNFGTIRCPSCHAEQLVPREPKSDS
jgi:hypothetical protein